ncbi:MAG: DUF2442 domain-containing protein [Flavobacteriaceae bacterium]|nr:DUF2442 domain-containing protein [Flavobacteriaceae bacterium]
MRFTSDKMVVSLEDGRELSIPLEWFPRLRDAKMQQLNNWRFIGKGEGVHWEDLDEDILIENLLE